MSSRGCERGFSRGLVVPCLVVLDSGFSHREGQWDPVMFFLSSGVGRLHVVAEWDGTVELGAATTFEGASGFFWSRWEEFGTGMSRALSDSYELGNSRSNLEKWLGERVSLTREGFVFSGEGLSHGSLGGVDGFPEVCLYAFALVGTGGCLRVGVRHDGRVDYGSDYFPTGQAREFWEYLAGRNPYREQLAGVVAANEALLAMCARVRRALGAR